MIGPMGKLISIRARLAKLTETQAENAAMETEVAAIIQELDAAITEMANQATVPTGWEAELARTTRTPIKPPDSDGPHPVKWKN